MRQPAVLVLNWRDHAHPHAGGAEIYTWEVLRRLVAAGADVTWFAGRSAGMPSAELIDGIRIVRSGGRFGVYGAAQRFWKAHRDRFDLVVDEVNTRPFMTPEFVSGTPIVALIHQVAREVWFREMPLPMALAGRFVLEPSWLLSYRHVPTLTVSPSSAQSLRDYGLRLVREIGVGRDSVCHDTVTKSADPSVLFVGRMAFSKRPDHVLDSMREVWSWNRSTRLTMVGDGPRLPSLRRKAARLTAELGVDADRVCFTGRVGEREKLELMGRSWVLAMASVREGWGMVVDEAAGCGTPTVGYRVPGLVDSIPAASGVLTDPDPRSLGHAVAHQLSATDLSGRHIAGWTGGAKSWDDVATAFAHAVTVTTGIRLSAATLGSAVPPSQRIA